MHDMQCWLRKAYRWAGEFSDDPSTHNGAAIITHDNWIAWGVNRFPTGVSTKGRLERPTKYDYMVHAEQDAILRAAKIGLVTQDATMVCPWAPCLSCARSIIQAGISRLVTHRQILDKTPERWREEMLKGMALIGEAGVEYEWYDGKIGDVKHLFDGEVWEP